MKKGFFFNDIIKVMFKNKNSVTLGCFSPPVMIATFIFEFISMLYVLFRYQLDVKSRLVALLLLNLAIFQLAEYMVCENTPVAEFSSRIGYAAITLLPVLGLHLIIKTSNTNKKILIASLYLLAFVFCGYFLISPNAFDGYECTGNYVIFQIGQIETYIYSTYYFGIIAATLAYGLFKISAKKTKVTKALAWLLIGYLVFILPAAVFTIINPDSKQAIPSILCGFAILLALILVSKISPIILKIRKL